MRGSCLEADYVCDWIGCMIRSSVIICELKAAVGDDSKIALAVAWAVITFDTHERAFGERGAQGVAQGEHLEHDGVKLADPSWLTLQQLGIEKRQGAYGIERFHLEIPLATGELLQRFLHFPSGFIQGLQVLQTALHTRKKSAKRIQTHLSKRVIYGLAVELQNAFTFPSRFLWGQPGHCRLGHHWLSGGRAHVDLR